MSSPKEGRKEGRVIIGSRSQQQGGAGKSTLNHLYHPAHGNAEVGPDGEDVNWAMLAQAREGLCVTQEHFISLQALLTPRLASHQPSCPLFFLK